MAAGENCFTIKCRFKIPENPADMPILISASKTVLNKEGEAQTIAVAVPSEKRAGSRRSSRRSSRREKRSGKEKEQKKEERSRRRRSSVRSSHTHREPAQNEAGRLKSKFVDDVKNFARYVENKYALGFGRDSLAGKPTSEKASQTSKDASARHFTLDTDSKAATGFYPVSISLSNCSFVSYKGCPPSPSSSSSALISSYKNTAGLGWKVPMNGGIPLTPVPSCCRAPACIDGCIADLLRKREDHSVPSSPSSCSSSSAEPSTFDFDIEIPGRCHGQRQWTDGTSANGTPINTSKLSYMSEKPTKRQ